MRRFPEVVAFCWMILFAHCLISGRYIYFLNPKFTYLIVIGFIFSTALFIGGLMSNRQHKEPLQIFTGALVLIVPILFYLNSSNLYLGGYAFTKKRSGFIAQDFADIQKSILPKEMSKGKYYKIPLNKLTSPFTNYSDTLVEAKGQIHRSAGQKYMAFFRFAITCCAADARPVGVILPINEKTDFLQKDDWAIIRGNFVIHKYKGKAIKQLVPEEVEKIAPPPVRERYLY